MKNTAMKGVPFIILGAALITATSSYAIESGTYMCQSAFGPVELVLKKSGRANSAGVRGFWNDYGDEAVVIKENWVLLDKGNGKYTYRGTVCKRESVAETKARKETARKAAVEREAKLQETIAQNKAFERKRRAKLEVENRKRQAEERKREVEERKKKAEAELGAKLGAEKCNSTKGYKINGNSTITDIERGLVWKQCQEGFSGERCETWNGHRYVAFRWDRALEHVQKSNANGGFAGYSDWRIPTIDELSSLIRKSCKGSVYYQVPLINPILFPKFDDRYGDWSNQQAEMSRNMRGTYSTHKNVNFKTGAVDASADDSQLHLLLVRSVQ